ncbi:hypothetical protein K8I61_01495 [bacterium]|nr:hypothetical protein [bacterium]
MDINWDEYMNSVKAALTKVGAIKPCGRCGQNSWTILPGFVFHPMYVRGEEKPHNPESMKAGFVCVSLACKNCRYLVEHNADVLGIAEQFRTGFHPRSGTDVS